MPKETPEETRNRELRKKIRDLRQQLNNANASISYFTIEKEKMTQDWLLLKRRIEEREADLLNRQRDMEDAQEKNFVLAYLYRDKIKNIMLQNADWVASKKLELDEEIRLVAQENRLIETEVTLDSWESKKEFKELELSQKEFLFGLKVDARQKGTLLREDYERQLREMRAKYDLKFVKLRREMEDKSRKVIENLEAQKEAKIKEITSLHSLKYKQIKNYFNEITNANLSKIDSLKAEIQVAQANDERDRKILLKAEETFKKLYEPLHANEEEIKRLREEMDKHKALTEEKRIMAEKIATLQKTYREMEYQFEITFQQFKFLEEEKRRIDEHTDDKMAEIYQKAGLKHLILERQVKQLKQSIEIKSTETKNLSLFSETDPAEKKRILSDITQHMNRKDARIEELHKEILQVRSAHVRMVELYKKLLNSNAVPVDELGFQEKLPSLELNLDQLFESLNT